MRTQLVLIDATNDWRLDERTKELGRRGVAAARAALAAATLAAAPAPSDDAAAAEGPARRRPGHARSRRVTTQPAA